MFIGPQRSSKISNDIGVLHFCIANFFNAGLRLTLILTGQSPAKHSVMIPVASVTRQGSSFATLVFHRKPGENFRNEAKDCDYMPTHNQVCLGESQGVRKWLSQLRSKRQKGAQSREL